ncbi:carbohydrate ABC transporter substrate-binding protein (CUT1 family) [Shinella granuli]|uniref:Carbohydrate ABC transporter substrate-binding protein (CUT1 family) n=1 Tax=Shinella granuli TaxID=323621 RepID=A0A4R2CEX3_SHIGR|nr:carbohydrate ABC transporter substrate-binding protein (CUT1 family) [Shinella granuli]
MITRRQMLQGGVGAAAAMTFGIPRGVSAQILPGKPFAGSVVNILLPHASQFRAHEKRFAEFEELTGIKAVYNYVPYAQVRDKIAAEAVAGSSNYDVVCYQDSWGPSLSLYLEPIDAWLARDGVDMNSYPQAYKLGSEIGGKVFGLPIRGHPQMLFYRKDLLAEAGVEPPATWEDLVTAAKAVQDKSGVSGLAMYYGKGNGQQNLFLWLNYLWGKGGDLFTPDFTETRFTEPVAIEATQMYLDLLLKHKVAAPGSVQFAEDDAVNSVAQGKSAMVMVWWWVYSVLTSDKSTLKADQIGFAPMPKFAGGSPVSYALSLPFAVSALSKQKDAAWEFMKWVSRPELEQACVIDKSNPDTSDIVVTHTASFLDPKVNDANFGLHRVAAQSLEGSRIMPQLKEWPQIGTTLENTISDLATGAKPVKDGLDEAARDIDRILRRAGYRKG